MKIRIKKIADIEYATCVYNLNDQPIGVIVKINEIIKDQVHGEC